MMNLFLGRTLHRLRHATPFPVRCLSLSPACCQRDLGDGAGNFTEGDDFGLYPNGDRTTTPSKATVTGQRGNNTPSGGDGIHR